MFELIYPATPAMILPLPSADNPGDRPRTCGVMLLEVIIAEMQGLRRKIRHFLGMIHKRGRFQMERSVRVVARNRYVGAESIVRDVNLFHNPQ